MTPPPRPPPPVPKPRARFLRESQNFSSSSVDGGTNDRVLQPEASDDLHLNTDEVPPPPSLPTLESVTDIIITNIPSLAGVASAIGSSASSARTAEPPVDDLANSIASKIPTFANEASSTGSPSTAVFGPAPCVTTVANTPGANSVVVKTSEDDTLEAQTNPANFDRVISSLANIPFLAGFIGGTNAAARISPKEDPLPEGQPHISDDHHTDVDEPSQLKVEGASGSTKDGEDAYITVLSCWANNEEADSESSNDEEDMVEGNVPSGKEELTQEDPASNSTSSNHSGPVVPTPTAPPPSRTVSKSGRPPKQKIPRAATIRVSRKKNASKPTVPQSAMVRASWLDVWKGFRHSVYWATLDGKLMSLWKKRTDRLSEVLFHVSSITNVKKQDKGRFSIYFKKKHYDFMAHSEEVQESWLTSLLACRGQPSPGSTDLHGPITIKDPRSRVYAALWGHDLWIYPNKEGFQLGVASFSIPLNIATVKTTGKHSLSLITPYKSLNLSVDSSKELSIWMDTLSSTIHSALSCSQVTQRIWENPFNKVCGDCGAADPDWASINLLMVICHECSGHHRALNSNLSKVRSLTLDTKAWTEPLLQLFVAYGNRLANQVWAPAVPAVEQLRPEATDEERSKFIQDKYSRGRYKQAHPLSLSSSMMEQRLLQVVCSDDVEETMSLICSGVKVCPSDPQSPSPILLAERANQALQTELLRINEFTEVPPQPKAANQRHDSTHSEEEELHGKLEEDRFLFSLENDSAACDVLDLREVHSIFLRDGPLQEFELVALSGSVICNADDRDGLLDHLSHILRVILPGGVSYAEVGGATAVSKVYVTKVGSVAHRSDAWLLLWEDQVSIHPVHRGTQETARIQLSMLIDKEMHAPENRITMATADRRVSLCFEEQYSCLTWFDHLQRALANHSSAPRRPPPANHSSVSHSLYPVIDVGLRGSVPQAVERCISHITAYGLKVEGVYRRCGLSSKVTRLVEALMTSPKTAPLESDEQGVLDAGSALKQYVRQQDSLIPSQQRQQWINGAVISDERSRFKEYRRLLRQLPDDNRATLNALFGHFYMIQVFSQVNKMSAHNLAVVLVPSLFQGLNQDLIKLTKEFIIHHTLLFLTPDADQRDVEVEEEITVL